MLQRVCGHPEECCEPAPGVSIQPRDVGSIGVINQCPRSVCLPACLE